MEGACMGTRYGFCDGCKTLTKKSERSYRECNLFVSSNGNGECPCSECLIKTMCNNICEKMDDFLTKELEAM